MKLIKQHNIKPQRGVTLIELLIAMALGLIVIASAITIFSGSRKSTHLNMALTDMQDSARFALNAISQDVRMSGFQGCIDINSSAARILAIDSPTDSYFESAVSATVAGNNSLWAAGEMGAPLGFTPPTGRAAPVPGTHALSVQFGSPLTYPLEPMATNSSDIQLVTDLTDLTTNDFAIVSDCQVADIFKITAINGGSIQHSNSGNLDARVSSPYGQAGAANQAQVMRFESNIYYVGDTDRVNPAGNKIYSLFKQTLPYTDINTPIEMVEGVANFRVLLGFRDPENANDERLTFVTPDQKDTQTGRIEVVQLGLLMQSYESILETPDASTYYLTGTALTPSDEPVDASTSYPADKRMNLTFNTSVQIRNRR